MSVGGLLTKRIASLCIVLPLTIPSHIKVEDDMPRILSDDALAIITIAQEAIGESYEGKLAVAEVIRNRMRHKYSSDGTVAGTVLRPWQFSGWNTDSVGRVRMAKIDGDDKVVDDCVRAWRSAKEGSNTVNGAVLYYAPAIVKMPKWARPEYAIQVAEIGGHVFFVPKGMSVQV